MSKLVWHFQTSGWLDLLWSLWLPIIIGVTLYYSSYLPIFIRVLVHKMFVPPWQAPLKPEHQHDLLVLMPTLLRKRSELTGLQRAIESVLNNGYPGRMYLCASIDNAGAQPELYAELERWIDNYQTHPLATLLVAGAPVRVGKAMAIENGVNRVKRAVALGELEEFPTLVMSMDADSVLGEAAIERLVQRITHRGSVLRQRPMIAAANVCVAKDHYWKGWRGFFSIRGQLALQVSREYMTSISLARNNWRMIPVTSVAGALYCTWSDLFLQGPHYAGFMTKLRFRDWLRWWFGCGAPSLAKSTADPLPEAMTGPGDDTWMAWLALSARWKDGKPCLELPRTPLHALFGMIRAWVFRPIGYVANARVYTSTPTTFRGLFRQRVRWNSSRIWLLNRFGWSSFFHWSLGATVYLDIAILMVIHTAILFALFLLPMGAAPSQWLALFIIANLFYMSVRAMGTILAMMQDNDVRGQWHKLLALPLSGPYHIVFNIFTTIKGLIQDLFLNGVNTNFAPESTLIKAGVGRVALLYRFRRLARLTLRSAMYGDVPMGTFWFGWHETEWTTDGYTGWTDPSARPIPARQRRAARRAERRATRRRAAVAGRVQPARPRAVQPVRARFGRLIEAEDVGVAFRHQGKRAA